jgi:hypothetical protein
VSLGRKLDPINKAAIGALGCGDKREEPVPRKEPAGVEKVDEVKNRGITQETHYCIDGRRQGAKDSTLDPEVVVRGQEGFSHAVDVFTKSLDRFKLQKCVQMLGLVLE